MLDGQAMSQPAAACHPVQHLAADLRPARARWPRVLVVLLAHAAAQLRRRVCSQARYASVEQSSSRPKVSCEVLNRMAGGRSLRHGLPIELLIKVAAINAFAIKAGAQPCDRESQF